MNLTQLRYVKAVAQTGSFTQAAEECFVTQPTLSNGIAQLEQEFEQRLFARTTRAVTLTSFGESILPFIDALLNSEKELFRQVRTFVHPERQLIRIGVSPLISTKWLRPVLEEFRNENNGADIMMHEQNMADLYHMLDGRMLDFVFGVTGLKKNYWESTPLYDETLYFLPKGAKAPQAVSSKKVCLDDIAGETFVMVPNACGLAQATRALFRSHRKKLKEYTGEALSYQILEEWVMLGLGAAILPKSKISKSKKTALPLTSKSGAGVNISFEAVWLKQETRASLLQRFTEHIKNKSLRKY